MDSSNTTSRQPSQGKSRIVKEKNYYRHSQPILIKKQFVGKGNKTITCFKLINQCEIQSLPVTVATSQK